MNKPIWQIIDGQVYVSLSHWGMFPVGPANPFAGVRP